MEHQQRIVGRSISLLLIRAKSNELEDLLPHVPASLKALHSIQAGEVVKIE